MNKLIKCTGSMLLSLGLAGTTGAWAQGILHQYDFEGDGGETLFGGGVT